jgi:hypothetical protein
MTSALVAGHAATIGWEVAVQRLIYSARIGQSDVTGLFLDSSRLSCTYTSGERLAQLEP